MTINLLQRMACYSHLGSWAIWESHNDNHCFEKEKDLNENIAFENYLDKLQPSHYIIVAMNPGGDFDEDRAKQATRKVSAVGRKWSNFHNVGSSRDYLLAAAIMSTKLYGSYMTDLFPFEGSNSDIIKDFVEKKENTALIERLVMEFDDEMTCLLPDEPEIILICIGKKVEKWANRYLVNNLNVSKKYTTYYFPHYSGSNRHVSPRKDNAKQYYPNVFRNKISEYGLDL